MAGIFDFDPYPKNPAINDELKLKLQLGYLNGLDSMLQMKSAQSIRSLVFDKAKFTKATAEKFLKDRGVNMADMTEDEKFVYAGVRKFSDFTESDVFEKLSVAEGIELLVKAVKPEVLEIIKLEAEFGKMIRHEGSEYCVYSADGSKKIACHPTKEAAVDQLRAIEANKQIGKSTLTLEEVRALGAELMKKYIKEEDGKYCVYDDAGNKTGTYPTRAEAEHAMMTGMNKSEPAATGKLSVTKNDNGLASFNIEIPIEKFSDEGILIGVVYEPDVVDAQGDYATADEIEKACGRYNVDSKTLGIMHSEDAGDRATILESYIAPADFKIGGKLVRKGSWVMKIKVNDKELWKQVKDGKITGLSMAGRARAA